LSSTPQHLAQINTSRLNAPIDDPLMAGFVARLVFLKDLIFFRFRTDFQVQ